MLKYVMAGDIYCLGRDIVSVLNDCFSHIDLDRVFFVRSTGSRSSAVARIHGLASIWRYVLGVEPMYIIEVVSENYDELSLDDKVKTIIHELLHIPYRFSGGLRPHGRFVNRYVVEKLYREYIRRGGSPSKCFELEE